MRALWVYKCGKSGGPLGGNVGEKLWPTGWVSGGKCGKSGGPLGEKSGGPLGGKVVASVGKVMAHWAGKCGIVAAL